jgi:hypothetical protein
LSNALLTAISALSAAFTDVSRRAHLRRKQLLHVQHMGTQLSKVWQGLGQQAWVVSMAMALVDVLFIYLIPFSARQP